MTIRNDFPSSLKIYCRLRNEQGRAEDKRGCGLNNLKRDYLQFGFGSQEDFLEQCKKFLENLFKLFKWLWGDFNSRPLPTSDE